MMASAAGTENMSATFACTLCERHFRQKKHLKRHVESVHINPRKYACCKCWKDFTRRDALMRHLRQHNLEEALHPCALCNKVFLRKDHLTQHRQTHARQESTELPSKRFKTPNTDLQHATTSISMNAVDQASGRQCTKAYSGHKMKGVVSESTNTTEEDSNVDGANEMTSSFAADYDSVELIQEDPITYKEDLLLPEVIGRAEKCNPQDVTSLYRKHWSCIRTNFQTTSKIKHMYNFRLQRTGVEELVDLAQQVFDAKTSAFKINVSFGFLLRHVETCELQYYYASNNTRLFTEPILVTNRETLLQFLERLAVQDPLEHVRLQRPNSKWVVEMVTNVLFYLYNLREHPIGKGIAPELPSFITNNPSIISLLNCKYNGKRFGDHLCLFRCLALHRGATTKALEKEARKLFKKMYAVKIAEFKGITMEELFRVEETFGLNIVVYELVQDEDSIDEENTTVPSPIVGRLVRRSLERYEHTMFVNLFENHFSYIQDIATYTKSYQCQKCLKLWKDRWQLQRHESTCEGTGVKHTFPGGVYTHPKTVFELLDEEGIIIPGHLRYHPYRAVFDFESFFKPVNTSPTDKLTWNAEHVPLSVSVCSNVPDYDKPSCFISKGDPDEFLRDMLTYLTELAHRSKSLLMEQFASYLQTIETRIQEDKVAFDKLRLQRSKHTRPKQHHLQKLLEKLEAYLSELPVIGFNSGAYDLNLVKEYVFPWLVKNDPIQFIVKRINTYMCVKSKQLVFLDIKNYIAPGFSYEAFLKAYDCSQQKGFFPYEWINLTNLNDSQLPPQECFYSDLKQRSISDEEYAYCQKVWKDEKMSSMRDFLVWYNNLDVVPFVEALEKMAVFYRDRKIDVFKDGLSVPGLTMKYLFQMTEGQPFVLFGEKDKDAYYTFRSNLVGGPSIIFHRYHERGKTRIRNTKNVCQKVIGFDANALYLWAIMQEMPAGPYIRRREDTGFKLEKNQSVSIEWLAWRAHEEGIHICHQGNDKEKRVGLRRIPVDGFCQSTNTVYQFHGCYWHSNDCRLNHHRNLTDSEKKKGAQRRQSTDDIRQYVQSLGYRYEEIWECEYHHLLKTSPSLQAFLETLRFPLENRKMLTLPEIVDAIRNNNLFGAVECDIHVPNELKPAFAEMCPIFKNTAISVEDIGDHMKAFAKERNIMKQPRRSLVGSMFGQKILLATPLIKWYLDHGLKITRVHQIIQFRPSRCFQLFGEAVSDARRAGDVDPSKAIIADTMKLIGNSSYGKTITNKEAHINVKIVSEEKASRHINDVTFRDVNEISDSCYEIGMAKRWIAMDLPLQIGFFVYQYAKLRMLEFYYDFLDKYFDRDSWQYVEMDTDSAYIAIAADTMEDILKPHMREDYESDKHNWLPRTDTKEHKQYDKRTPGLFKVEWEGEGIVALNSKMYYCFNEDNKDKFSCKGVSKRRNDIRKEMYYETLKSTQCRTGENKGFRVNNNRMFTYTQSKDAFTYFYPKRKVLQDGVQTTYLDL